ncbi:MAG: hypothetical protein AAFX03_14330 [Pseudomonadota bacterium]
MRNLLILGSVLATLSACAATPEPHAEVHVDHVHVHGDDCGHAKVWHVDHWDYLHDGHLHAAHGGHYDEHVIEVSAENPIGEAPVDAAVHADHAHGDDAHLRVRHGGHTDYIHDGRLHFVHGDHVDDHGPITVQGNG